MHHFGITVQAFSLPKMSLLTVSQQQKSTSVLFHSFPLEASLLFFSTHFTNESKGAICTTQSKGIVRTCIAISYNLVACESDWNIWLVDFGGTDKACRDAHISWRCFQKLHCFPLVSSKLKVVSSNFEDFRRAFATWHPSHRLTGQRLVPKIPFGHQKWDVLQKCLLTFFITEVRGVSSSVWCISSHCHYHLAIDLHHFQTSQMPPCRRTHSCRVSPQL